jgi:hypothetical protein
MGTLKDTDANLKGHGNEIFLYIFLNGLTLTYSVFTFKLDIQKKQKTHLHSVPSYKLFCVKDLGDKQLAVGS